MIVGRWYTNPHGARKRKAVRKQEFKSIVVRLRSIRISWIHLIVWNLRHIIIVRVSIVFGVVIWRLIR